MALTNLPGRTPLGVCYRSPLGVLTRPGIHTLVMVFCSSQKEEEAGDTYPFYDNMEDGVWTDDLALLVASIASHQPSRVCLIGVKRSGAINDVSTSNYTTGLDKCVPASWLLPVGSDEPDWIRFEEWEPGGAPGTVPTNPLTEALLTQWYDNSVSKWGKPEQVVIGMTNDSGSMARDMQLGRVSPWTCYSGVTIAADGLPPVPIPWGDTEWYYQFIEPVGGIYFAVADAFNTTLAADGITTRVISAGYCSNQGDAMGGEQDINGFGEVGWPAEANSAIVSYVPAL